MSHSHPGTVFPGAGILENKKEMDSSAVDTTAIFQKFLGLYYLCAQGHLLVSSPDPKGSLVLEHPAPVAYTMATNHEEQETIDNCSPSVEKAGQLSFHSRAGLLCSHI